MPLSYISVIQDSETCIFIFTIRCIYYLRSIDKLVQSTGLSNDLTENMSRPNIFTSETDILSKSCLTYFTAAVRMCCHSHFPSFSYLIYCSNKRHYVVMAAFYFVSRAVI